MITISDSENDLPDEAPTAAEDAAFYQTRSQCRHIFTQGHRCRSACLRGEFFCYHHHTTRIPVYNARQRRARQSTALASGQPGPLELPMPEDRAAIGLAAGQILHAIAANTIDLRRAGMMLYALQIANCALPRQTAKPSSHNDMEEQAVDEIVHHPDLGIIAPETDLQEVEESLTPGGRRYDEMKRQMELDRMTDRIKELEARLSGYEPVTATVDLNASWSALPGQHLDVGPTPVCRNTTLRHRRNPHLARNGHRGNRHVQRFSQSTSNIVRRVISPTGDPNKPVIFPALQLHFGSGTPNVFRGS